ncbi:MAG: hypothetical protein WD356_00170 [Pseudomonadales bacterium]
MLEIPLSIPAHLESHRSSAYKEFIDEARQLGIPEAIQQDYFDAIFAIAAWTTANAELKAAELKAAELKAPLSLGVAGAQGSGKSTLAVLLSKLLDKTFDLEPCVLSLDDFYKTRAAREQLARDIHPLLKVRGVPGTHDMSLMNTVISDLKAGLETRIPQFDKGNDDRSAYRVLSGKPSVLILEGWCWGARPVAEWDLVEPVNQLEAEQDSDALWRTYVNECLAHADYQRAFHSVNQLIYLAVPDMESVYRWRLQQEQALAERGDRVMNEAQVREFIMYYERITRRMLAEMPDRADITLCLDSDHSIEAFKVRD